MVEKAQYNVEERASVRRVYFDNKYNGVIRGVRVEVRDDINLPAWGRTVEPYYVWPLYFIPLPIRRPGFERRLEKARQQAQRRATALNGGISLS